MRTTSFPRTIAALGLLLAPALAVPPAEGAVKVPALVGSHMVLQADEPARVWGWASPGETVRVTVAGAHAEATTDGDGRWATDLPPQPAGGPHELTVSGEDTLTFEDVWFGEVWVGSGQSNMQWTLARSTGGEEAAGAGCEGLRLFTVTHATSLTPREDVEGQWVPCTAETAPSFSAVAFHFGQKLHAELGVKIGLIHSSWGGTPAEAWTSREALEAEPSLRSMVAGFDAALNDPKAREAFAAQLEAWEETNYHQDTGNEGLGKGWARPDFDASGWETMELPVQWEQAGHPIDGALWFRRSVEIPADWAGADLLLSLGAIDDFDTTYFAGEEVGRTGKETPGYYSAPRRYTVPGRLVAAGPTVVAVRAFDHFGNGGFTGSAPEMSLSQADGSGTPLPLDGPWAFAIERSLEPSTPDFGSQPRYPSPDNPNSPTVLYGAMVAPLTPYTIRGAIWYQGEANAGAAWQYRTLFPTMIRDWRRAWGRGDFPFLFVQLANFMARSPEPGESAWAELREAQALTLGLPNTGMAVIIDIGEADDIHPRNKVDVGHRLARWALADTYGRDVVESGPLYASSAVEGGAVRVRFHHADGLTTSDGEAPRAFAVAGEDRRWRWADARIDGESLLVSSPDVPQPVAARYAWADNPEATLTGGAGLPASPFRTDDWPALTAPQEMADGRALVRAMHARYADRWYRDLMLVQDVTHYEDGRETGQERMTEYISLPGRVRAIIGDIEEGDADIYVDGAFHRFEDGEPVGRLPTVHAVLVAGFDVYAQDPERTIAQLDELGIDLERLSESTWNGRPAWVVGAAPGDDETPQMWVEKDRLLCVRVLSHRPYGVLDIEMGGYEPLGEGWIATELVFKRNGALALREDYAEYRTVDGIDPALFDVEELKTTGPLPSHLTSWRNPVIPGFHPDPSAVRVGDEYYLVTSSFEFFPGVPVFESGDLVHWQQLGHALTRRSQLPLEGVRPSGGIFAPTIRHHDGTFYMITTNVTAGGNFYVTASDPAGPWSEPIWVRGQGGIDPSLFFDEDGTVYFTSTGGAPGTHRRGIHQSTIDVATGELLSPPRFLWEGTGGRYPEGPHLYRVDGRYYLLISEGGTEYGHMVTIARSDSPWGPFEACPRNPILTHRDTQMDVPVQGTGHAELVQDHEGNWWMLFLAYRPVGGGYWHHLGRETFLAPVTWDAEGWPVVNGGEPVGLEMSAPGLPAHPVPASPVRTDFEGPLGPEWNYLRNPDPSAYSTSEHPGRLTLRGKALTLDAADSPTWVGRRQQHLACRVETRLDFSPGREGDEAGLTAYRNPEHHYVIGVDRPGGQRRVFVRQVVGPSLRPVTASALAPGTEPVTLRIEAAPEEYRFSFALASAPDEWVDLGSAPTRLLSSEVAHGFTGAYFALYATGNGSPGTTPAVYEWFDYEPLGP